MKIRTDFVTNSSSSNFVTICIKNPKFTELMCEAMIPEEDDDSDMDGDYYSDRLDINESEQIVKLRLEISYILNRCEEYMTQSDDADSTDLLDIGYPPENFSSLSQRLIRLLKEVRKYTFPAYDFAKICSVLEQNGEDIIADTESVDWTYQASGHGEANLYNWFWVLSKYIAEKENLDHRPSCAGLTKSFHYDKENGESLNEDRFHMNPHRMDITYDDLDDETDSIEDDEDVDHSDYNNYDNDHLDDEDFDDSDLDNDDYVIDDFDYSVFNDSDLDEDDFDDSDLDDSDLDVCDLDDCDLDDSDLDDCDLDEDDFDDSDLDEDDE